MSIEVQILGGRGADNAAYITVDSGQAIHRLLFDCGEGCAALLPFGDLQAIEHLCFSHLHIDHVAGFDSFFRANYGRESGPVDVWGPARTTEILHHRFQGFLWNLTHGSPGTWLVHDIEPDQIITRRCMTGELFATAHPEPDTPHIGPIINHSDYRVTALIMDHATPSVAYVVEEPARRNFDADRLPGLGLQPGSWMRVVRNVATPAETKVSIGGMEHTVGSLREALLVESPGQKFAYLTDFLLDEAAMDRLTGPLDHCDVMVCEAQYRHDDLALARKNRHMTATLTGQLAARVRAKELTLFHLSDRYTRDEQDALLAEARTEFPAAHFPAGWTQGPEEKQVSPD